MSNTVYVEYTVGGYRILQKFVVKRQK